MNRVFKRRKGFKGIPAWKKTPAGLPSSSKGASILPAETANSTIAPTPAPASTSPIDRPVPAATASGKKLALTSPSTSVAGSDDKHEWKLHGYRLIDCETYIENLKGCKCPKCGFALTLWEDDYRRGLVSKLKTVCTNNRCKYELVMCDPYAPKAKALMSCHS